MALSKDNHVVQTVPYRETLSRLNPRGAKGPILNSPDEISRGQSQFDQR